jgi:hypothetical protein
MKCFTELMVERYRPTRSHANHCRFYMTTIHGID